MNYSHAYHAGNFADVLKHIVLLKCLEYLQRKAGPLCFIDAHSGSGLYRLDLEEAAKTREWERGIGSLAAELNAPIELKPYLDAVKDDFAALRYPGSPLLLARHLRAEDRLLASELYVPAFDALKDLLHPFKSARAMHLDAYQCIRAHIPPKERRGVVLVDPPFEQKNEFEILARQ